MEPNRSLDERRRNFVQALYRLHWALTSESPQHSGEARRALARLRRSFAGPRQQAEAYDIVFPHDPPQAEQELWLLVAGLFALHPHGNTAKGRTVGGAMRLLADERVSTQRRFTQLLCVDRQHLPYHLRQMIQLLRSDDVAIDYHRLLADLVLIDSGREAAHKVRLRWARDYYRPRPQDSRSSTTGDDADADEPPVPQTFATQPIEA
ncbi:type I-E CRISPR-associated protein Cse2/CasB [Allorhizocola rhizosphaerae]|uniref:type I-E CRISPR-associated protein Cse2/CasB n=1 Tax=Allorhizocola rhizosphaerae TaxID=1872709 RepID=UPI0013C2F5A0|nr:type I-E CRISPR-associated protein Cse2/CasB [Allorhizocola rhizosphaerae]